MDVNDIPRYQTRRVVGLERDPECSSIDGDAVMRLVLDCGHARRWRFFGIAHVFSRNVPTEVQCHDCPPV